MTQENLNHSQIEELRALFRKAREAPRNKNRFQDSAFHSKFIGALNIVGKKHLEEFKEELYFYLDDPLPDFRENAIMSLGFGSRLLDPDFEERAYQIWKTDPDESVRDTALDAWTCYYSITQDPKVLQELYDVLISKTYSTLIRSTALFNLKTVSNLYTEDLCESSLAYTETDEFERQIDWEKVRHIMQTCVPGWKDQRDEAELTQKLKKIFDTAKKAPRHEKGFADSTLQVEVLEALILVGQRQLEALKLELYTYLKDPVAAFRVEAVASLGSRNRLFEPSFRDQAYGIWKMDNNEEVRAMALKAWWGYYAKTKDQKVLETLYQILNSKESSFALRQCAALGLVEVSDLYTKDFNLSDLSHVEKPESFERMLKSEPQVMAKIHDIMKTCIPGWQEKQ